MIPWAPVALIDPWVQNQELVPSTAKCSSQTATAKSSKDNKIIWRSAPKCDESKVIWKQESFEYNLPKSSVLTFYKLGETKFDYKMFVRLLSQDHLSLSSVDLCVLVKSWQWHHWHLNLSNSCAVPLSLQAYFRQGVALQYLGRHADALAAFASGLAQDPKSLQLLVGMVEAAMKSPMRGK